MNSIYRLVVMVLASIPCVAFAQSWPPLDEVPPVQPTGQNDVAVIVAVEDYLLLPDVPGAIDNANEWEVYLRNGLQVPTVRVLANRDATREEMLKQAKAAARDVKKGGTIWWIFIGHGAPAVDGKDGLLVGMDAQQSVESLTARGLPQKELLETLESGVGRTVMVVDACFSGRSADGEALAAGVQPVVAVDPSATLRSSSVVLSAARATEVAGQLEGAARPAFSYLLLGALRGWADDGDGKVTAGEALYYTQRKLRGVKGRQQTPQGAGNLQLTLVVGVEEGAPQVVAEGIGQESTADTERTTTTGGKDRAALTLEYLQRRIVFDGRTVRQAGGIIRGPEFYHAIGRPDLAPKWKSHEPLMWVPGIALIGAGVALFGYGINGATSDKLREQDDLNDTDKRGSRFISGTLGGFFALAGGVSLVAIGSKVDHHPMSFAERRSAAAQHNAKLREERGLGPEVDRQNEPSARNVGPWSVAELASASTIGFNVRF